MKDPYTSKSRRLFRLSDRRVCRPVAILVGAIMAGSASAQTVWSNLGTDWATAANWSSGVPTSGTVASFNAQVGTGTSLNNPIISGAGNVASGLNLNNNFLGGAFVFTGTGTLTLGSGGIVVRGFGTQTINGPTLAGAAAGNLTINVGADAGLTLSGATTATTNVGVMTIAGTLTLNNVADNTLKVGTGGNVSLVGGTLSVLGNSGGTAYTKGSLSNNAGYDTISVTNLGGTTTSVNFSNSGTFSLRTQTYMVVNFNGGSGTLGASGGPQVTFTGTPFTTSGVVGGNGNMIGIAATGTTVGFATVTDAGGTNWATYATPSGGSGGIKAITPSSTVTDATVLSGLTSSSVAQFNPAASTTITATGPVTTGSLRITPAGSGSTLAMGSNNLQTNAFMLDGSNDFTITGTGVYSSGLATRYIYVNNASTALTTSMVIASGSNPTDIAGPGFVVLSGNGSQNTLSSTNRLNLIGGVLRANNTQIGFGATGGSGMMSMRGGVLEIQNGSNGTGSSADFLRPLATTATAGDINWSTSATDQGSGGFSAFGAAASVNLGGSSKRCLSSLTRK